jgi:hypothetical protein
MDETSAFKRSKLYLIIYITSIIHFNAFYAICLEKLMTTSFFFVLK